MRIGMLTILAASVPVASALRLSNVFDQSQDVPLLGDGEQEVLNNCWHRVRNLNPVGWSPKPFSWVSDAKDWTLSSSKIEGLCYVGPSAKEHWVGERRANDSDRLDDIQTFLYLKGGWDGKAQKFGFTLKTSDGKPVNGLHFSFKPKGERQDHVTLKIDADASNNCNGNWYLMNCGAGEVFTHGAANCNAQKRYTRGAEWNDIPQDTQRHAENLFKHYNKECAEQKVPYPLYYVMTRLNRGLGDPLRLV
jgi:hypothetical protein